MSSADCALLVGRGQPPPVPQQASLFTGVWKQAVTLGESDKLFIVAGTFS